MMKVEFSSTTIAMDFWAAWSIDSLRRYSDSKQTAGCGCVRLQMIADG
ncbi:MAG: hypothetical protein ACLRMX_00090 [Lachnospira eligens]